MPFTPLEINRPSGCIVCQNAAEKQCLLCTQRDNNQIRFKGFVIVFVFNLFLFWSNLLTYVVILIIIRLVLYD